MRHEEALIARKAVDDGRFLTIQRKLVRGVRHFETAEIADVLAHREIAVHADAFQRTEGFVLRGQPFGLIEKFLIGFGRPPVTNLPGLVEFAALIIESMTHLVTDHRANRAVVHGRVSIRIEEWRLQDRRGECDLVHERVVVRIHLLRVHAPLGSIDRLIEPGDSSIPVELATVANVFE